MKDKPKSNPRRAITTLVAVWSSMCRSRNKNRRVKALLVKAYDIFLIIRQATICGFCFPFALRSHIEVNSRSLNN